MVSGPECLHSDQAGSSKALEKLENLAAAQLPPHHNLVFRVNPVNLEHVLRQIQSNRRDAAYGSLLEVVHSTTNSDQRWVERPSTTSPQFALSASSGQLSI